MSRTGNTYGPHNESGHSMQVMKGVPRLCTVKVGYLYWKDLLNVRVEDLNGREWSTCRVVCVRRRHMVGVRTTRTLNARVVCFLCSRWYESPAWSRFTRTTSALNTLGSCSMDTMVYVILDYRRI